MGGGGGGGFDGKRRRDGFDRNATKQKVRLNAEEVLESKLGFDVFTEGDKRLGWLLTFAPVSVRSSHHSFFFLFFNFPKVLLRR